MAALWRHASLLYHLALLTRHSALLPHLKPRQCRCFGVSVNRCFSGAKGPAALHRPFLSSIPIHRVAKQQPSRRQPPHRTAQHHAPHPPLLHRPALPPEEKCLSQPQPFHPMQSSAEITAFALVACLAVCSASAANIAPNGNQRPRPVNDIETIANQAFDEWGGLDRPTALLGGVRA